MQNPHIFKKGKLSVVEKSSFLGFKTMYFVPGAFRVEMQRESQKDRTILCKYDPTEPGDYRIEVKWSGEHVPGSPFMVMIFDTQEELTRFVAGQYGTTSATPGASDYFGEGVTYGTGVSHMSWRGSTHEL